MTCHFMRNHEQPNHAIKFNPYASEYKPTFSTSSEFTHKFGTGMQFPGFAYRCPFCRLVSTYGCFLSIQQKASDCYQNVVSFA